MNFRGEQTSTGTLIALLLLVLGPALCVVWFMNVAMRNERLAVRQTLTDAYHNHLLSLQRQLATVWKVRQTAFKSITNTAAAEIFAAVVRSRLADAAVVYDTSGNVLYPGASRSTGLGQSKDPPEWAQARDLEFQGTNYLAAAESYGLIAQRASDIHLKARAKQSQASCFLKAGQKPKAADLLADVTFDATLQAALSDHGALLVPNVQLLLLKLTKDSDDPRFQQTLERLTTRLNDYSEGLLSVSQRRFLMEEVQNLAGNSVPPAITPFGGQRIPPTRPPGSAGVPLASSQQSSVRAPFTLFPTLEAERLAAEYLDTQPVRATDSIVQSTQIRGVLRMAAADGTIVALFKEDRLRAELMTALNEVALPDIAVALSTTKEQALETPLLRPIEAGDFLPDWRLALTFKNGNPFDAASNRQTRFYLWTGLMMVLVIGVLALAVARNVIAQMELARFKDELVSTVSHELKTPLASMRALADTLSAGRYRNAQQLQDYLGLISKENQRLSHLIDNFLAFSRLESGKHRFRLEDLSPRKIVDDAVDALKERLMVPPCSFESKVHPGLPGIRGDADALTTVLINLLDNAHKYTEDEKRISLRAYANGRAVYFEVEDNGIGLNRAEIRRVFDRFYQADQSLTRKRGGCGLGLSIVYNIVQSHGGAVEVQSEPGKGSIFRVKIPFADHGDSGNKS